jgi:hypothetical protein
MYSKFRKNKIPKKVKSPISMRNRRFNTSKCRGKLQKMGVLPILPKALAHILNFQKKKKKKKKIQKKIQKNSKQSGALGKKKFKKSKNSVRSYDAAQNRFVPRRDKWSFRG